MITRASRRALARALFATTALISFPVSAQLAPPAPVRQSVDARGVNLFDGQYYLNAPVLSMGQGDQQGMSYYKLNRGGGWTDNLLVALNLTGSTITVVLGGSSDTFTVSGSTYTNTEGNGATLAFNSTSKVYTYTSADGTVVHFNQNLRSQASSSYFSNEGRATDVVSPSGAKLTFGYQSQIYCDSWKAGATSNICLKTAYMYRPASVRNSSGYQIAFNYDNEYSYESTSPETQPDFAAWADINGVTATNLAVASGGSSRSQTWETVTNGGNTYYQITDPMNRVSKYRMIGGRVAGITLPGDSAETTTVAYTSGRLTGITTPDGTTTYSASDAGGVRTVTVTDPLNHATVYRFDIASQRMTSVTDANNHTTSATYDPSGRIKRVTKPEGNYTEVTYDGRGNVTEQRLVAKSGSGFADIVRTAGYDSTCLNALTCNQPNWTKDAKGNQTDYTYDPTHGGVLTVTSPAPSTGAVRPQTRFGYTSLQAYFKNASGSIVASGEPIYKLTSTSQCQTLASCSGGVDEVKTSIGFGPQTSGIGNNLLPVSTSKGAGDNSLTATVTSAYDDVGNLVTVDGPLSGAADTTRSLYNADRETTGMIEADPDGAGALKNRATRITIDGHGLVTKKEVGTTNGQTDTDFSNFTSLQTVDFGYDTSRRVGWQLTSGGGTYYSITHTNYDAAGRPKCTAVRMNPAAFFSMPDACALGTQGSDGPDRISQIVYDAADQPVQFKVAVGTADEATERTIAYTPNGIAATLTDGENNRSDTYHDGFDRLGAVFYPSATKGVGTTNYGDKEEFAYDANGNLVAWRNRAGALFNFTYDNLDRLITKDRPGSDPDIAYTHDLLARMTSATFAGSGLGITNSYDALGRITSSSSDVDGVARTTSSQYDLLGNQTLLTSNTGGYSAPFTYDVLGRLTAYGSLVQIGYDDLGRRSAMTMSWNGNTSSVSYGYDPIGRLSSLADAFAGGAGNQATTFAYNPASQIKSRSWSNDTYAFPKANGSTAYASNGLNQYSVAGGANLTYDGNGNLASDGSSSYAYDSENRLVAVSGARTASLSYDPLGRLWQVSSPSGTSRFVYDGLRDVLELDGGGNTQRAIVYGDRVDEPLVWWEGRPKMLHADERGSIVAVADTGNNSITINKYDEYGNPQGGTISGRFGYTAQMWLPEIGLQYSKARMYSPALGRFVQTDPIGAADDPNLYQYSSLDPVDRTDPSGLTFTEMCTGSILHSSSCSGGGSRLLTNGVDAGVLALGKAMGETSVGGYEWIPGTVTGSDKTQISITGGHWQWNGEVQLAQNFQWPPEALPNHANDNETGYETCTRAGRLCRAWSRMIPNPVTSNQYLGACVHAVQTCVDRMNNPDLRTSFRVRFPNGRDIVIGPRGRVFIEDGPVSHPLH